MIIKSIDCYRVRIPLAGVYTFSRGSTQYAENIIIRVNDANGMSGLGECCVRAVTGDLDKAEEELKKKIIPAVLGMDSLDLETIIKKLNPESFTDLGPLAGIELALWDLNGKNLGVPVYELLGGRYQPEFPVSFTLGHDRPQKMLENAHKMFAFGYRTFVVKTEMQSLPEDIEIVRLIRREFGTEVRLKIDANAGYSVDEAIEVCRALEPYDLDYIEQPIVPGDMDGLRKLAESTEIPICIDEDLQQLSDAYRLIGSGAVSFFNIKPPQCGGLWLAKKMAAVAESAGIRCICGGRLAFETIRQASRHLVACTPAMCNDIAHEGPGPASQGLKEAITEKMIGYSDVKQNYGRVSVSSQPGLGVELKESSLSRYLVSNFVISI